MAFLFMLGTLVLMFVLKWELETRFAVQDSWVMLGLFILFFLSYLVWMGGSISRNIERKYRK